MNLTNRLGSSTAGAPGFGFAVPAPSRRVARLATAAFLVVVLFIAAGAAGLGLYASSHTGRIYEGIDVAGIDLGGLTPEQARAELEDRFAAYAAMPLTLSSGDHTFQLTPAEAGARLDSAATVDAAMAWGRQGSLWDQSRDWTKALLRGVAIAPVIALDPHEVQSSLAAFAPKVVKPAIDATLTFDQGGQPSVVPDITGVRLDYVATTESLAQRIADFANDPVPLVTHDDPAAISASSLSTTLPAVAAAVDEPLMITAGDASWHVPVDALQPLFGLDPATSHLTVDSRPIRTLVENLATDVNHDAVDAGITVDDNGHLAVVPAANATAVDVDASVAAIANGLLHGDDQVALVVKETPPQIVDDMAAAAVKRGEALMTPGIALTWRGGQGMLDRGDLLRALTINSQPGKKEPFVFGLDPNQVWNSLSRYATDFDIPVQDARWRIIDGKIQLAVPESKGRALNLETGVASVMAAFLDHQSQVELDVRTIMPHWTAKDGAAITLGNAVLGEGATYYGDSSDARRNNIEVASSYLSGWLVPPGGVFSYAETVGQITEDSGFVTGLGIVDDGNGGFTTAPVVGGGICQVSTTLFQAVFWSGLPVLERHQHPYYLRNYGEAVTGLPGLDAMVNIEPDWRVDLRFQNTTGYWMAVILVPDGTTLYARIVGTDPGWDVVVPDPTISNQVHPDETMRYEESPELPLGQEKIVESAQDGFDVRIDRTVKKGDQVILQDSFSSSFAPSHNTTLRGTGTESQ
jgi:vancomycin resistance protein YoaR